MKRRDGSSRRQVLDIDHSSSSWKSKVLLHLFMVNLICNFVNCILFYMSDKYSNIAQRNVNGSSDSPSNPLSKLVGSYASDEDEDDASSKNKSTLDAKVEEFMKVCFFFFLFRSFSVLWETFLTLHLFYRKLNYQTQLMMVAAFHVVSC